MSHCLTVVKPVKQQAEKAELVFLHQI